MGSECSSESETGRTIKNGGLSESEFGSSPFSYIDSQWVVSAIEKTGGTRMEIKTVWGNDEIRYNIDSQLTVPRRK